MIRRAAIFAMPGAEPASAAYAYYQLTIGQASLRFEDMQVRSVLCLTAQETK
jgi:hypothetical protein